MQTELFAGQFLNPRNIGAIDEPEGFGEAVSFECGAIVRISLRVDPEKRIADAKFKAIGCQVLIASASRLTDEIKGKTTAEAAQLVRSDDQGVASNSCVALCGDALLAAISRFEQPAGRPDVRVAVLPRSLPRGPQDRVNRLRVGRIENPRGRYLRALFFRSMMAKTVAVTPSTVG